MRRPPGALALFIVLAVLGSCQSATPAPSGSPGPAASVTAVPTGASSPSALPDMSAILDAKPLPVADPFALTRAMRGRDGQPSGPFQPVRTTPPVEDLGSEQEFWTYDFAAKRNLRITATIRIMTEHAKWWVQNDLAIDLGALRQNATFFETNVYPTDRRLYGSEWSPGIDGDPRIDLLVARIPGAAAGYFNSSDELPRWVNEYSAEREMIYINSLAARAGDRFINSVAAHEFCHMIQYGRAKRSAAWFNEGQAQLCELVNGFGLPHAQTFLNLPDTQLDDWPEIEQSQASYGETQLFLEFLRQQAGGDELINAFMAHGIDTPADLDAALRSRGQKPLADLYADFVAANAFIGTASADPATTYPKGVAVRSPAGATQQDRVATGGRLAASVHQYAARYVELPRGNISIDFSGATRTKLLPTDPHTGSALWWSDRADGLDSTLTRGVDLSRATAPTLSFWTWFEIEKDYDYAYVAVSADGGTRWTTLPSTATTAADPNGQNLGNGYTGTSGGGDAPRWIQQHVDLTAYAGRQILLRFEYVTDASLNLGGFAIDDIEIPSVLADRAETDAGWQLNGFVRSTNYVAQRFVVQLLRFTDGGATVERHLVEDGTLRIDVDTSRDRRPPLLAVTGLAVRTTQRAPFEVAVRVRG